VIAARKDVDMSPCLTTIEFARRMRLMYVTCIRECHCFIWRRNWWHNDCLAKLIRTTVSLCDLEQTS